ncbi:MAG: tetratricopeptide repeat protein, partial [Candidatus Heimdallarchaeota archaeon]|nr:tetratricopeptide repeat protein [Candidatus Heimdallarchaeota archaeon]
IHAKLSLEQYTQVNDTFRQGRINQLLGIINHHQMDLDQAMGYYNNAIKIFHQLEKYVDTTYSYIGIANAYLVKGEPRNAIEYFENGLLFYEDHIDFLAKASILTGLGNAYRSKGELDKAQELYIQARKLYERSSNPLNEAAILYYLGETYFIRGENDVALENYGRALKIYDQHTSPLDEAKTLTGIGNAYRVEGDLNTSKEKYLQAIKLYEDNNSVDKSHPLKNLAENYILQKKYDEAIKYVTEAMNLLKSNPNKLRIAIPLNKLGRIHYARGDYKKGFIFCAQSAQILEHSPNPQDIFRPLDIIYNYEPKKAVFLSISNPLGINWLLTLINNIHNSGDYLRSSHWYYLWLGVSNWWNIIWSFPSQSAFIDSVFNSNWRIQFLLEESQRNITSETSLNLLFGANDLNTDMTHNYKNFRNPQEELDPMWFVELPTKVYHGERYLKIRVNNLVKIMGERSSFPLSGQTRFPAVARVVFELETQWLQKLRIDHLFYPNSDIEHQKYQLNPSNTWLKDIFVMDMDDKLVSENKLEIIYSVELYFELNKSIPDIKTTSKRITLPIVRKNNLQVLEKFKVNHANSLAVFIAFWSIIITILPLFIDYGRIISKYIDISLTSLTGIFIVILTSFISAFFFKKKNKELLNESVSKSRDEISIEKEEDIGLSLDKINLDNIDFDFSGILDFFRDDSD